MRDRSGAGGGLAHAPAEDRAHIFEEALLGLLERRAQLLGDLFFAGEHVAHLRPQLQRGLRLRALLRRLRLDRAVGERVDLLEDARHRGQEGRFDLLQLADDLLDVAPEVGDRRAPVDRPQLDQQRERVGEGQEQVGDLVLVDLPDLPHHVDHRAVVAVG